MTLEELSGYILIFGIGVVVGLMIAHAAVKKIVKKQFKKELYKSRNNEQ